MDLPYDSAFPVPGMPPVGTGDPRDGMAGGCEPQPGISVRAYIATKAIQGILAGESDETGVYTHTYKTKEGHLTSARFDYSDRTKENELVCTREQGIAKQAVAIADALIAELKKQLSCADQSPT